MRRPLVGIKPGLSSGITDMMYREPRAPVPGLLGGSASAGAGQVDSGGGIEGFVPSNPLLLAISDITQTRRTPPGSPQMGGGAAPFDPTQAGQPTDKMYRIPELPGRGQPMPLPGGPTNYPGVSTPAVMPPSFGGGVIGYTPPPFSGTPDFSNSQPMPMPTPGNRPGMGWGAAGPRPMPPGGGQTNWKPPMGGGGMGAGMMPTRPGTAVRPPRKPINVPGTRGPMRSM